MKTLNILFIVFFFTTSLFAEKTKLKIAVPHDMVPYTFQDKNLNTDGFFIDYWKLWAKKTNVDLEFLPMSWKESLDALKNKEIDLHTGLFKNEQRQEYINFLKPIYPSKIHIYINKNKQNKIKNINDLENETVGVLEGAFFKTYLIQNHPTIKIKEFSNLNLLYDSVKRKEIDIVIDDSLIIWFQLIRDFDFTKMVKLNDFELTKWFYSGIRKDDIDLEKLVLDGISKITNDDIIEIEKKWILDKSSRYFEQKKDSDLLSKDERAWLLKNSNISFAVVKKWDSYSFLDSSGKVDGFHIDLINKINENLHTNIKYKVFDSWSQAYNATKNGETGAILGLSWSEEREKIFNYSPSYHYSPYYIVSRDDEQYIKSIEDFNNKIASTYENSITSKFIKNKAPNTKIIHRNSVEEILKSLRNKEADVALLENAKRVNLKQYGLKIVDSVFTKYGELSIGSVKRYEMFSSIIEKGIYSIEKEQLNKLKNKWFEDKAMFTKEELSYISGSKVLTVGIEDWPAIIGTKDGKTIEGVGGELAIKALKISGLKFQYVQGNWDELLRKFKNKEIDILPTTTYTKERDEYGDFTKKYLSIKNYIYVKSDNNQIKSFDDLSGKKLAIQKDYATVSYVREKYPNINIIETKNLEESMHKVLNGEVDALFELQISVENKMREFLITNLKSITQNDIESLGLHIFLTDKDKYLQSILNKSLDSIPSIERNIIISKWLNIVDIKKKVNVAFGLVVEPYVMNKKFVKGISYDLTQKILSMNSIEIENSKNISYSELDYISKKASNYDMVVHVKEDKDSSLFYSDDFMTFDNVAISRKKDNLNINTVLDLKDKRVVSFMNSSEQLGEQYKTLFSLKNRSPLYSEELIQEKQVQNFLNKKSDVIILDKEIFKWYLYRLSSQDLDSFQIHNIFPNKNNFKIAFKDKNLRDIFNKNLLKIKETGEYSKSIEEYISGCVESKVQINTFISSMIGEFVFNDNRKELNEVIDILSAIPYISKIDVYEINGQKINNNKNRSFGDSITHDIFYIHNNIPQKVGLIKVFYKYNSLKQCQDTRTFIPPLELFKELNSFGSIKTKYKKFGYLNKNIVFSQKELSFMKNKKVITLSSSSWPPVAIQDNNKYSGLFSDYLKIIEEETGLVFKYIHSNTWQEVLNKFKNKDIDIIPSIGDIAFGFKNAFVTNIFVDFKFAIISNKDRDFIDGLKNLNDKVVAVPKNYTSYYILKNKYPNIKLKETSTVEEALNLVSKGEADASVAHSAVATYNIKKSFPHLKIVGFSEEKFNHRVMMQDTYPELLSIMNKVISHITPEERIDIRHKWIKTEIKTAIDYTLIYNIIAVFSVILVIVLIFTKKLSSAKLEVEKANNKMKETVDMLTFTKVQLEDQTQDLEDSNHELEQSLENLKNTQNQLIESEKMASLGALVAGVAHEINTPIGIGRTGATHLHEITLEIQKLYASDKMSQEEFEKYLKQSLDLTTLLDLNLKKAANLVKSFKQVAVDQTSEERRNFNLRKYIDEILMSIHNITKRTNLNIVVHCDNNLEINSYPGAISQVLTNLIMNSIVHGYEKNQSGELTIDVKNTDKDISIIYKDDGKGISKENLHKIFDPFFTTNREQGGSGLGLNIIYNIIRTKLNGRISCESNSKGVEFIITFSV